MSAPSTPSALFTARSMSDRNRSEMRLALDRAIQFANRNQLTLRVPHESKPVANRRDMHYHYRPEIFLQLEGSTDFHFPREKFSLHPDEIGVIPAGVPHGEI